MIRGFAFHSDEAQSSSVASIEAPTSMISTILVGPGLGDRRDPQP